MWMFRLRYVTAERSQRARCGRIAATSPVFERTPRSRFVCCADMAREQYLDHLASVPLFSGCTTKELRDIAKATVELTLDEGKEFVTQGDVGREAFVIVEGHADVSRGGNT